MIRNFLTLLCILVGTGLLNAQSMWLDVPASAAPLVGERRINPEKFRAMRLNLNVLQPVLASAPELFSSFSAADNLPVIELPSPDGKMVRFQIAETPVLAPEIQAKYPNIRCYTGRGIDDRSIKIKLDLTPMGLHAMVTSSKSGSYFIDPMIQGNSDYYVVYFKKDYLPKKSDAAWACETPSPDGAKELELGHAPATSASPDFQGDTKLRRYRLALACTGEYATFHGGTKPLVLAAMVTTMNRVNGVYENDFAVTMQIIANNDLIIYLTAGTDPYTNGNGGTMLGQNITTCNNVIGSANYDIGHVFSTGGGGVANLGVVCGNSKAGGVTGSGTPVGDPFDIDYVAHELGHQFAGSHTFNNCSGTNNQASAVEPGSGTTIMAYAGICGATNNVAAHSEDFFHGYNITEMGAFIYTGSGNNCPVKITTSNNNPVVEAGLNYTIPKSTPFALTAVGSDVNGDTLTYTWEQMDNGAASSPPQATNAVGPLFRSLKGTTSPTRVFPRLVDIVNNVNPTWEELPGVARNMKFRVVVRDNDWFAGCTAEDDMNVTVAAASGPFLVTVPNTNVLWNVGTPQTVTWDVANTTAAPVSCSNVRISLSTDGGFTYPVVLADNEPNDGMATISVPNNVSTTCRVKVEGMGNIFFDISNTNFRIEPPVVPTFFLNTNVSSVTVCAGDVATFSVDLAEVLGFNTPANISITGAPVGAMVGISPNPVIPAGSAAVTISNITTAMAGVYTLDIQVVAGAATRNGVVTLTVLPGIPVSANLDSPANGATGLATIASLQWTTNFATNSLIQIATNPSFVAGSIISTQTVSDTSISVTNLTASTVYYWRVRSFNDCGTAAFSPVFAFQTGGTSCGNDFSSTDVPKLIDQATVNTVNSTLMVPASNIIADVNISLAITHTYTGDLVARLVAPSNDTIDLFDQPGVPSSQYGCAGDNASLTFDSQSAQNATVLENQCNGTPPSLFGTFQPGESLAVLNGKNAQGTWKLLVTDNFAEDGGSLTAWSISLCFPASIPSGSMLANNPLSVPANGSGDIVTALLEVTTTGTSLQGQYIVTSLPAFGVIMLNGAPLVIGAVFTQADINAGLLVYTNNGDPSATDNFHFDVLDANNFAWIHDGIFNINVVQNNLAATAVQTANVLCFNGTGGEITVDASGLDNMYLYSLNGGMAQSSNVFSGLAAGTYTVVVTGQFGFTISANEVVIADAIVITMSAAAVGQDVTVTAAGGTGIFEYSINGVDFQTDNMFVGVANGVYTVTVQDENGCTATTEVIVAFNTLLITSNIQTTIKCAGAATGVIAVNVGGGQSPFTYSINGGMPQSSNIFMGLVAGTYTVVVTDGSGFTAETTPIVLDEPSAIIASASAALNVVTVTASGGTGALQYSQNGGMFQSSNIFPALANGNYTLTVRDANGCTKTVMVTVNVPTLALATTGTATLNCFGAADGSITATVTGGIPPYQYKLNNGMFQASNVFAGLAAGAYTVTVRDAFGTEVMSMLSIGQPTQVVASITVVLNDGTATFSGGTTPYAYTTNAPNIDLQNLPNGTYALVVTDANGCTGTTSFTVNVPPLSWSSVISNVTCFGAGNGTIAINSTGGIPPYQYSVNGGMFQSSNLFIGLIAGPYTVIIRDSEGGQVNGTFTITAPTPVVVTATSTGSIITAVATGGIMPYQYSLNNGPLQSSGIFSGLNAGSTYTAMATDANGCTATLVVMTSAVIEPTEVWGLTVSPNPGSGLFQLTMQHAPAVLRAEVFDGAGRLLRSLNFAPNGGQFTTTLDLQDLPNGTYILRLTDGQQWGGVRLSKMQ